jgi:hypothetical protein
MKQIQGVQADFVHRHPAAIILNHPAFGECQHSLPLSLHLRNAKTESNEFSQPGLLVPAHDV